MPFRRLFLAVFLAAALPGAATCQDADILFEPTSQIPAQGGPGVKLAFLPGGSAFLQGGVGSLSVGDGISLGVGGYSLDSQYVAVHDGIPHDIGYSYGGITLDDTVFNRRLWNIAVSFMAGPAQGWSVARMNGASRVYVNFLQIEPGINFVLNVTHELRISVGTSYRFAAGSDMDGQLGTDLDGSDLTLILMYGKI